MKTFQPGQTYTTRSICDHDCIVRVSVARRTAKTIVTTEGKTLRVALDYNGNESVQPWGRYSMAPMVSADKVQA
jgi:hypothetical protein